MGGAWGRGYAPCFVYILRSGKSSPKDIVFQIKALFLINHTSELLKTELLYLILWNSILFLCCTIRYIQWAHYLHTIQVKSVQSTRPLPGRSRASTSLSNREGMPSSRQSSRLLVIAVFRIHPLELVTCLSVDRHVSNQMPIVLF